MEISAPGDPTTFDAASHGEAFAPSLRHRATTGLAWTAAQAVGSKVISVAGQIALAWFLDKDDFALIALTATAAAFANFAQQTGVREVLVQRQAKFGRWVTPAFWIALTFGLVGALLLAAAAPVAAAVFHSPKLIGLLLLLAAAAPFDAVSMVPLARLQAQLRFGMLARVGMIMAAFTVVLSVLLAKLGFGAYSFVLPRPIVSIAQTAIYWQAARLHIRPNPELRRWRYVLGDSGLIMASAVVAVFLSQGDYMVLGLFRPKAVLGVYYFAFSLSTQAAQLIAFNLASVLFPTYSRLEADPVRQTRASIRASRLLALVATPLCILQAAVAGPLIRLVYRDKWVDAIAPFQALSIGMALVVLSTSATSLIQAQRRFRFLFLWYVLLAAFFLAFAAIGAKFGGAMSVACAVALFYAIFGPLGVYVSVLPGGGGWRDVLSIYLRPVAFGAVSAGTAILIASAISPIRHSDIAYGLCVALMMAAAYLGCMKLGAKEDTREIESLLKPMLSRFGLWRS